MPIFPGVPSEMIEIEKGWQVCQPFLLPAAILTSEITGYVRPVTLAGYALGVKQAAAHILVGSVAKASVADAGICLVRS